jgi:hypothetical protein
MYIPLQTTKIFFKNIRYALEYPGTTVAPPMVRFLESGGPTAGVDAS